MSSVRAIAPSWWLQALLLLTIAVGSATVAQEPLIIDVPAARAKAAGTSNVTHYKGDWSVRHSEQRSYSSAESRREVDEAQDRTAGSSGDRRSATSESRSTSSASDRTTSRASERHGSVRLDTVR
jgi:hypothetical protein